MYNIIWYPKCCSCLSGSFILKCWIFFQEQVHNSTSAQPLSPIPQMEPTSSAIMELHHDAVPKNCVRQASFPVTPLPTQMISCPTRQMSLPAQVSSESNGFIPKPLTTSQVSLLQYLSLILCRSFWTLSKFQRHGCCKSHFCHWCKALQNYPME